MALSGKVCTGVTKAMPSEVSGTARASPHHLWSKEGFQKFCLILSNLGRFKSFYFHQIYASLQDGSSEHTQKSTAKCTQGYKHFPITSCPHTTPIGYFRKKKKEKKQFQHYLCLLPPKLKNSQMYFVQAVLKDSWQGRAQNWSICWVTLNAVSDAAGEHRYSWVGTPKASYGQTQPLGCLIGSPSGTVGTCHP